MKVGTFFSGIGSPEQALLNLGIKHDIEFACDIDKYARETYLKNFDCKNMYEDITDLDMKDLSYVDLLVFGFPCQAFSMAGKRGGFEDTRGTLFYDALRYLKEHNPRYFIAENVKGLLSHDSGKTFQTIIDCLASTINTQMSLMPFENLGYHIYYKVLNTKDFGIPQNRERIFIVGIRDDADNNFRFPKEILLKNKLKDLLQINVDNKYYLSDKMIKNITTPSNGDWNSGKMTFNTNVAKCINARVHKMGRADTDNYIISHSLYPRSSKTNKGGTGHLSKTDGTSYCVDTGNAQAIEWVADYRNDEGLRKRKDKTTPCLTASKNSETELSRMPPILKQDKIRRLTPIECERLQGFPDNHTEGVSDTQRYKQCGNSITVNVMEAILKNLLNGHS
jgi:DNA (cytosine-5)-methyltransferase 1